LAATAARRFLIPVLIDLLKGAISEITIKPEPNETSAASVLLPNKCESSPFARDCSAINTPEIAASASSLAVCECVLLIFETFQTCIRLQPALFDYRLLLG
jgi:hypothetical protein